MPGGPERNIDAVAVVRAGKTKYLSDPIVAAA